MPRTLLVLLAAALVAGLAGTAAATTFPTAIKASKKGKDGPYHHSPLQVSVGDDSKYVHFKISNLSDHLQTETLTFGVSGATDDYGYRWTHRGENVTPEVNNTGYDFQLRKLGARRGRSAILVLRLKPLVAPPRPLCVTPSIHTEPDNVNNHYSLYVNSNSICG